MSSSSPAAERRPRRADCWSDARRRSDSPNSRRVSAPRVRTRFRCCAISSWLPVRPRAAAVSASRRRWSPIASRRAPVPLRNVAVSVGDCSRKRRTRSSNSSRRRSPRPFACPPWPRPPSLPSDRAPPARLPSVPPRAAPPGPPSAKPAAVPTPESAVFRNEAMTNVALCARDGVFNYTCSTPATYRRGSTYPKKPVL